MAWRFKASKYKNAAPIVPKPEACIREICVGSYQTYGNNIAASAAFMAFNWEHTGSSLAVLSLDDCGRKGKTIPLLHAHTDTVTDLSFSPFHDGLLATASQDCKVKIWHIPEKGLEVSLSEPECTFSHKQRRVETLGFHPTADGLLHSTSFGCVNLFDLTYIKEIFSNSEHPDVIQSVSWKQDGTVMATSCKDKYVRILDPRANGSPIQMSAESHQNIKDSRITWLGNQNRILSTGFNSARLRQVIIRDLRNFSVPEKTLELDCSTGVLMPLFDPDTNMLFLAGKGDTTINYLEVSDKDPYLIEGLRHTGEQTKGACLVPKRALRVMEGEVNRVLQLTSHMVIPIMYQVPRKTYRDFHSDLYPDTASCHTDLTADDWMSGMNTLVPKMSLDPNKREMGDAPLMVHRGNLNEYVKNIQNISLAEQFQIHEKHANGNTNDTTIIPKKTKFKQQNVVDLSAVELNEIMKKFDLKYKTDSEKDSKVTLVDSHIVSESSPPPTSLSLNDSSNSNSEGNSVTSAPTPMPRTSRNNSLVETAAQSSAIAGDGSAPPKPKPRTTTSSSYKPPRLGPKPFSSNSVDASFDKVFAVPVAPGSQENLSQPSNVSINNGNNNSSPPPKHDLIVEIEIKKASNESEKTNTGHQKTLSTSERRKSSIDDEDTSDKIFEPNNSESSENSTEGDDKADSELRRFSPSRCSIAERRRMYEMHSKSAGEERCPSPVSLRRELSKVDSFKSTAVDSKRISVPDGVLLEDKRRNISIKEMPEYTVKNTAAFGIKKSATEAAITVTSTKRTSTVFGKVSKFRHLKGTPGHKSTHIENLRNLSRQTPGECNGFTANYERVAVPLSGPGGKIAIFELKHTGRLPDGVIPSLVNGSNVMDFQWDPFNTQRLAVACDDGIVKLWLISSSGLTESTNKPEKELIAHGDKIYFIRFHPLAADVLLTASYDMTMKLWNLKNMEEKHVLFGHTDQIFDFAWSPCGKYGATVCKDGKLRIYNPRQSETPIEEGNGPLGTRGARIVWALEGHYIVCTGFDKVSERQISVYKMDDLKTPLNTASLDVSPSILMPFYDEDSSTLFVTGKGDSTIYCFEITDEDPYVCPLSHHRCLTLHQGLCFLTKNHCDVASVEFCRAYRLTNTTIEPLSFTVPRIKSELFQDDLFPPTRVTWLPTMTAEDWFLSNDKEPNKISLKPDGMDALSSVQQQQQSAISQTKRMESTSGNNGVLSLTGERTAEKQKEIQKSVSARMEYNTKLEQDEMEGVDENEWQE